MALWAMLKPRTLLGGEEELMNYPVHIRRAFAWAGVMANDDDEFAARAKAAGNTQPYYGDLMRENVRRFIQRWGGVEDTHLLRVLHEDHGVDRIKAIFALGYRPIPEALETIAPCLQSANRMERCATACMMGVQRDERAIPVLKEYYLQDAVDASGEPVEEAEGWYQYYYEVLALVLANWGPPEMTEILRSALLRILSPEHKRTIGHSHFAPTHLFYALGRRGDLSLFYDVQLSDRERYMALFSLAVGHLRALERFEAVGAALKEDYHFQDEISAVWKKEFGLSQPEIWKCFSVLDAGIFSSDWWSEYKWSRKNKSV